MPSRTVTVIPPGFTVSLPIRLDGSVMDHVTGPPEAVSVKDPPVIGLSRIDLGATLSVPCFGGGGVAEGVLVTLVVLDVGAGEPPPVGAGELPAEGPGDLCARPLADTAGCAVRLGPAVAPDVAPDVAPGVAPALPTGPAPRAFGRP